MTPMMEDLKRRERQFAAAQQVAQVGSWEWDIEANLVTWSDELYRIVGFEADSFEATYEAYLACVHPDDRERVNGIVGGALQDHAPFAFDHRIVQPHGTERVVHGRGEVLLDDSGTPVRMIGTGQDITERIRAEEETRRAREEADRANRAKTEFLSRMSHELRTPLNAILGFAQLLEMSRLVGEQREGVEHILRGGRHLLRLIDDVLDIARIEEDQLVVSIESVSVDEVVGEVLGLAGPLAAQRGVQLHHQSTIGDLHIAADRQRLKQVLLNFISNAIKYNRAAGEVVVAGERNGTGRVRISVSDTGSGIHPDKLERLFTPFDRLGAERTAVEGTGIGLALSKRLTELMDGELLVESVREKGSVFTIELREEQAPTDASEDASVGTSGCPRSSEVKTVLYVEDNPSNLKLMEQIFARRADVHLLTAVQGRLGIELAMRERPDLILLDVHLPDIDGDEVLRQLQADAITSAIPVVTLSAEATPAKVERFLNAGARAYMTKPLDVPHLLQVVDEILGQGRGC